MFLYLHVLNAQLDPRIHSPFVQEAEDSVFHVLLAPRITLVRKRSAWDLVETVKVFGFGHAVG